MAEEKETTIEAGAAGALRSYTSYQVAAARAPRVLAHVLCLFLTSILDIMASANPGLKQLSNALATPDQLSNSSSAIDGVPSDLETSIRCAGAQLTQAAGVLLRLSQDIISQAIVIFTRFWLGADGGSLRIYSVKVCALEYSNCTAPSSFGLSTGCIGRGALPHSQAILPTHLTTLRPECLHGTPLERTFTAMVREPARSPCAASCT